LGVLLGVLLVVAGTMFGLAAREISRNPTKEPQGPADGYAPAVSISSGLLAVFGVWGSIRIRREHRL
jgi:hypothetical protein